MQTLYLFLSKVSTFLGIGNHKQGNGIPIFRYDRLQRRFFKELYREVSQSIKPGWHLKRGRPSIGVQCYYSPTLLKKRLHSSEPQFSSSVT